jgi:hypothetical protein
LTISLTVEGGKVTDARITAPTPKERPVPRVVFWKNVHAGKSKQALHVDWRPDFLRRVSSKEGPGQWVIRPRQRKRAKPIDLIMLHQPTGDSIGSALGTRSSASIGPSTRSATRRGTGSPRRQEDQARERSVR